MPLTNLALIKRKLSESNDTAFVLANHSAEYGLNDQQAWDNLLRNLTTIGFLFKNMSSLGTLCKEQTKKVEALTATLEQEKNRSKQKTADVEILTKLKHLTDKYEGLNPALSESRNRTAIESLLLIETQLANLSKTNNELLAEKKQLEINLQTKVRDIQKAKDKVNSFEEQHNLQKELLKKFTNDLVLAEEENRKLGDHLSRVENMLSPLLTNYDLSETIKNKIKTVIDFLAAQKDLTDGVNQAKDHVNFIKSLHSLSTQNVNASMGTRYKVDFFNILCRAFAEHLKKIFYLLQALCL